MINLIYAYNITAYTMHVKKHKAIVLAQLFQAPMVH